MENVSLLEIHRESEELIARIDALLKRQAELAAEMAKCTFGEVYREES